jgi:hypothetical protein
MTTERRLEKWSVKHVKGKVKFFKKAVQEIMLQLILDGWTVPIVMAKEN